MSTTVQSFIAAALAKAAVDLETAYLNIPEDKRSWSPEDSARSANDQVAECAVLSLRVSKTIINKTFGEMDIPAYFREKAEVAANEPALLPLLRENVALLVPAIENVKDDDLSLSIPAPWGPTTISDIIIYPYWNLTYHLGQINYIASILGCLK